MGLTVTFSPQTLEEIFQCYEGSHVMTKQMLSAELLHLCEKNEKIRFNLFHAEIELVGFKSFYWHFN